MPRDDWFRNEDWNEEIERRFFEKLGRARQQKAQYLKLQAFHLAGSHPRVALVLLEKFYELKQDSFLADALVVEATAYKTLGLPGEAIRSLKRALEVAQERGIYTSAWHDFVLLVADCRIQSEYEEALRILESQSCPNFPTLVFRWNAAYALIKAEQGKRDIARKHALIALEAAERTHSGLSRHPTFGTVGFGYEDIKKKLHRLATNNFFEAVFKQR
jgi:tetratricopeptide (TPR) repeat protein